MGAGHAAQAAGATLLLPLLKYNSLVTKLCPLLMIPKKGMNSAIKFVFSSYLSAFQNLRTLVIQTTGSIVIHILGNFQCPASAPCQSPRRSGRGRGRRRPRVCDQCI